MILTHNGLAEGVQLGADVPGCRLGGASNRTSTRSYVS